MLTGKEKLAEMLEKSSPEPIGVMDSRSGEALDSDEVKSKILIVDDSATIHATLSRAVKGEFISVIATNGEQAWRLLLEDPSIKLVVTDLAMPELDGYGLIKRIRSSDLARIVSMPLFVGTSAEDT